MRTKTVSPERRLGWLVAGLAAASLLAGAGFVSETLRARQIDLEIRDLKNEADGLRVRNFQISSLQTSLESGEFIEREARMKLGLQKEGEHVVVLTKAVPAPAASGPAARSPGEGWSNAKKWWMYFADPRAFEDYARSRTSDNQPAPSAAL